MLFALEGNVGVGKSTVIQLLREKGIPAYFEPTDEFLSELSLFQSSGKPADAIALEVAAVNAVRRIMAPFLLNPPKRPVVVERSEYSAAIFMEAYRDMSILTQEDVDAFLNAARLTRVAYTIYLRASVATCRARISSRGDTVHEGELYETLHETHDRAFGAAATPGKPMYPSANVAVVCAEQAPSCVCQDVETTLAVLLQKGATDVAFHPIGVVPGAAAGNPIRGGYSATQGNSASADPEFKDCLPTHG